MTFMENRGEIILYQPDDEVRLEVRLEEDTVRLNRQQLSELFGIPRLFKDALIYSVIHVIQ